ncbi:molecular chaperone TorD family protein [Vibrio sp. AK197]
MMNFSQLTDQDTEVLLKLCGALFYYHPDDYQDSHLSDIFHQETAVTVTPVAEMIDAFRQADGEQLGQEYDRLFCGVEQMKAPPWGSAYLDKEAILFGDSTVTYRDFLQRCGVAFQPNQKEPEDHFGLMMMVLSLLLENRQSALSKELLEQHLLTWSDFFLQRFQIATKSRAFSKLASVSELLLSDLSERFKANPEPRRDYWHVAG